MTTYTNVPTVFGMCKNCKCVIVGDDDDSQGFCTDDCWDEWKQARDDHRQKGKESDD